MVGALAPSLVPWQDVLRPAVVLWIVAGCVFVLAAWLHHRRKQPRAVVALLCAGVIFVGLSAPVAIDAYHQYEAINTFVYDYSLEFHANGTTRDAIVVPIPGDETLVSSLRVVSGVANWSLIDSEHGRGLYVAFTGNASFEARLSVSGPSRFDRNDTPTVRENASFHEADVWVYHASASELRFDLYIGCSRLSAYPTEGWRTYHVACTPHP